MDKVQFIAHRVNTIEELKKIPKEYGVEIDLRDDHISGELIMVHDPFVQGQKFKDFLKEYDHKLIILNIKSERIEYTVLENIRDSGKDIDYFFLDSSFPMIYTLSNSGERKLALRYSEFESLDSIMLMKNRVDWIWVDCFTKFPLEKKTYDKLKKHFKLCYVSPELQQQPEKLLEYRKYILENDLVPDAICTKIYNVDKWNK